MFNMYDVVQTTTEVDPNIPSKTRGVILMVLDKDTYLVELFNNHHDTIGILEITSENIEKIWDALTEKPVEEI